MLSNRSLVGSAATVALAAIALAGCHGAVAPATRSSPAVTAAPTTVPQAVGTLPPTTDPVEPPSTTTTPTTSRVVAQPATFPPVVNAAMETFKAEPGLEAPVTLPPTADAVSAQTTDLGGSDSVTLVATPKPLPVNDPSLAYSPSTDLGTFTSSPTADLAAAARFIATDASNSLAGCTGTAAPIQIAGASGTSCQTFQGMAITWTAGDWKVQVLSTTGTSAPTQAAAEVQQWIATRGLPAASAGVFSAATPGSSSLAWSQSSDVYQTRSPQSLTAAAALASSMRPWSP
jgi:hypothetical protein